jgi:hypothetical protein
MVDYTIREINRYLKKDIQLSSSIANCDIKQTLLEKYRYQAWDKAGCKTHYNFYVLNKNLGFNINYEINKKKCCIIIEDIKIPIRLQDYFHYIFVNKIKKYKLIKEWFDEDGFLSEEILNIEQTVSSCNKKIYRTDMEIQICPNNYICIEFFENKHKNFDDTDMQREKSRIYNLLHENNLEKKYLHFAIFWENKLNDERYFKKFIISLCKKIKDYQKINNKKKWCVDSINSYICNEELSEKLYDAFQDTNKPIFKLADLNTIIQWKNSKNENKYFNEFKKFTDKINTNCNQIDDDELYFLGEDNNTKQRELIVYYVDNILTYNGFMIYINILPGKYLKNEIDDKYNLITLFKRITDGFIEGTEKRYELLNNINEQLIYGLYDY